MIDTLLRTIPKGVEEITTVLGLLGILLFLLSRNTRPALKWTIVILLLFVVSWRMEFSRFKEMSSRYVSGLIIPFVLFAVYFLWKFQRKNHRLFRFCTYVALAVLFLNYIKNDVKRNRNDLNYYTIADIVKSRKLDAKEEAFLISEKDFERVQHLCKTDNVKNAQRGYLPYGNNFEQPFYPTIIDIDSDNSIGADDNREQICSFLTRRNSSKRIRVFRSEPSIRLEINPSPALIDTSGNILQNGTIEELDSPQDSYKKLADQVANYNSFFKFDESDESARTPKKAYFKVTSGTEKIPSLGIDSVSPIDGLHSAFIKFSNGAAFFFFGQQFRNGHYSYSFLLQGKKGTSIQPVYSARTDGKWSITPICLFTVPDSRTFRISCSFVIDGLKNSDFFFVGVKVQNGETLLDDFVLNRKELD